MADVLIGLALVFVGLFVILSIMIVHEVSKRGIKINYFLIKLYIIKYVNQYKKLTLEESGRVGPLYYPFIISVSMTLIFAIGGLILK